MSDFNNINYNDLDQLARQRLVFDTKELSSILKGHLFIERLLERYLKANLPNPEVLFGTGYVFPETENRICDRSNPRKALFCYFRF